MLSPEGFWCLRMQTLEKLFRSAIRLRLEPCHDSRPRGLEGVCSRPPVAGGLLGSTMSRAHLASTPGHSQALQKDLEVGISMRERAGRVSSRKRGEVVLHRPNLVEEAERIQRG